MGTDDEFDAETVAVKTYVPAYQRQEWERHAEALGMSRSEFVRTMVQAGRRSFEVEPVEDRSDGSDPGGNALESRVLDVLADAGPMEFDELVAALTDDVERRLEETLQELQAENRVAHRPRQGYALEDP